MVLKSADMAIDKDGMAVSTVPEKADKLVLADLVRLQFVVLVECSQLLQAALLTLGWLVKHGASLHPVLDLTGAPRQIGIENLGKGRHIGVQFQNAEYCAFRDRFH